MVGHALFNYDKYLTRMQIPLMCTFANGMNWKCIDPDFVKDICRGFNFVRGFKHLGAGVGEQLNRAETSVE